MAIGPEVKTQASRHLEAKAWPRGLRHSRLDTHSHVLFLSSGTVYMQTCYCAIVSLVSRDAQRHFLFDNCCYHAWLTRSAASLQLRVWRSTNVFIIIQSCSVFGYFVNIGLTSYQHISYKTLLAVCRSTSYGTLQSLAAMQNTDMRNVRDEMVDWRRTVETAVIVDLNVFIVLNRLCCA